MDKIPRSSAWCSHCISPQSYGITAPCANHRGADGQPVEYAGSDAYDPSAWVRNTVGRVFRGTRDFHWVCFGYDPRHGFWMRAIQPEGTTEVIANVSERAIGRTFHELLAWPSEWHLLEWLQKSGRMPEIAEIQPMRDVFGEPTDLVHIQGRLGHKAWVAEDKLTLTPIGQAVLNSYRVIYGGAS